VKTPAPFRFFRSQRGDSLVEVAIVAPVLVILVLGIVEFGRAWYLQNEMAGAAQAGAIYGSQNPTDTSGMQTVAQNNAPDVAAASDVTGLAAAASWGCECSDGTAASANCTTTPTSCSGTVIDYVTVKVSATYKPAFRFPGSSTSFTLAQTVTMRSAQ
jgi:Flp pilus assembly protein TadG